MRETSERVLELLSQGQAGCMFGSRLVAKTQTMHDCVACQVPLEELSKTLQRLLAIPRHVVPCLCRTPGMGFRAQGLDLLAVSRTKA